MASSSMDELVMDNSGDGPLQVPGFGAVPLYHVLDSEDRFAHGSNDWRQVPAVTARELAMVAMMNALTDKRDWHLKIFDSEIVARWREEAFATMPLISPKTWDWCLAELRDKAVFFEDTQYVRVLDTGSCICKSDSLVPESLRAELRAEVSPLLAQPVKDWHPKSNEQVLNLVHPSLFPLVYGRSRVLTNGGRVPLENILCSYSQSEVARKNVDKREYSDRVQQRIERGLEQPLLVVRSIESTEYYRWSPNFQWLPCEVEFINESGTDVRITSYINNLHPGRYKSLYQAIEKLISLAIKPWNDCLIKGNQGPVPLRIRTYGVQWEHEFPEWVRNIWKDEECTPEVLSRVKKYLELPDYGSSTPGELPTDWQENRYRRVLKKFERIKHFKHPEPGTSFSYMDWKGGKNGKAVVDMVSPNGERSPSPEVFAPANSDHEFYTIALQDSFRKQGLQIIVKLAGIELTPAKPSYPGGNWHLEGLLNEHIVATAIYYYDVENVTETCVSFRQEAFMNHEFYNYAETDDGDALGSLAEILGTQYEDLRRGLPLQDLGSVATPQGRLITWPNTLQHCVEPFRLVDPNVSGHRRFIVLWLVDPHYRVCSTRNVPPQQHDWWAEAANAALTSSQMIPQEVADLITDKMDKDWPIGIEEARTFRLELMKERTWAEKAIDDRMEQLNFCEH